MTETLCHIRTKLRQTWQTKGFIGLCYAVTKRCLTGSAELWARFWMRHASLTPFGRLATRVATWGPLPYIQYYEHQELGQLSEFGYVAPSVQIHHDALEFGKQIFINSRVHMVRDTDGGPIRLGDRVWIGSECLLTTGAMGTITIGQFTSIGPRCELMAYLSTIQIGAHVMIASQCRFFPYDHGTAPHALMQAQQLRTKGDIVIEDDVWLGTGVVILSGVRIGKGAVVGAGSVITKSVPPGTVVAGNPAHIVKRRGPHARDIFVDIEHDALMVRNQDGTIRFWNKGAEHLYGWDSKETIGKRSHNLLQTIFPQPLQSIEEELRRKGYWEGELVHICRDGSRMTVRSRWELQFNGSDLSGTVIEINTVHS